MENSAFGLNNKMETLHNNAILSSVKIENNTKATTNRNIAYIKC